jgi:ABC-2 type transport system ATP-binding protein
VSSMISIDGLTKRFGPFTAVDNISFSVGSGEVLGFLGPNGAGKSTTMKMVTGYLPITAGSASVCGFDVVNQSLDARKKVGYLPEGAPLYGDMSGLAFLNFIAEIRGFSGSEKKQRVDQAIEKLQLQSVINKPIDTLSKGFKRRVGLAQAILHDPDVLILDEPTDGLDPNQKHQVRTLIKEMASDKAIVISTHLLEEVSAVCTRAVVIAQGRIVFDGSPEELSAKSPVHNAVTIKLTADATDGIKSDLQGIAEVDRIETVNGGNSLLVVPKDGAQIIEKVSLLVRDKGIEVDELYVERGHLDQVFRELTLSA